MDSFAGVAPSRYNPSFGVFIKKRLSSILLIIRRCFACFLDAVLLSALSYPVLAGLSKVQDVPDSPYRFAITALLWIWVSYFVILDWRYGATFGKFVVGLRVKTIEGKNLTFLKATIRTLLIFVVPSILAGLVIMLLGNQPGRLRVLFLETLGGAFQSIVPISVLFMGSNSSLVDFMCGTRVEGHDSAVSASNRFNFRIVMLCCISSLFAGLLLSWFSILLYKMMDWQEYNGSLPVTLRTIKAEDEEWDKLMAEVPDITAIKSIEEISPGQFPEDAQEIYPTLNISESGTITPLAELFILKNISVYLQHIPEENRPKCVVANFKKAADLVLVETDTEHRVAVCLIKTGASLQAHFIGQSYEKESVSIAVKYSPDAIGLALIGQSEAQFRRGSR